MHIPFQDKKIVLYSGIIFASIVIVVALYYVLYPRKQETVTLLTSKPSTTPKARLDEKNKLFYPIDISRPSYPDTVRPSTDVAIVSANRLPEDKLSKNDLRFLVKTPPSAIPKNILDGKGPFNLKLDIPRQQQITYVPLSLGETSVPSHSLAHPQGWTNNRVSMVPTTTTRPLPTARPLPANADSILKQTPILILCSSEDDRYPIGNMLVHWSRKNKITANNITIAYPLTKYVGATVEPTGLSDEVIYIRNWTSSGFLRYTGPEFKNHLYSPYYSKIIIPVFSNTIILPDGTSIFKTIPYSYLKGMHNLPVEVLFVNFDCKMMTHYVKGRNPLVCEADQTEYMTILQEFYKIVRGHLSSAYEVTYEHMQGIYS